MNISILADRSCAKFRLSNDRLRDLHNESIDLYQHLLSTVRTTTSCIRLFSLQKIWNKLRPCCSSWPMNRLCSLLEELKSLRYTAFKTLVLELLLILFVAVAGGRVWLCWFVPNFQNRGNISASIAIIGCRPYSHKSLVEMVFSAFHHQLMCSGKTLKIVDFMEFIRDPLSKQVACSTRRELPTASNIFWIAPNQVTKGTLVRDLLISINSSDLIECANVWTQASMHTEDLLVYQGGQSKAIKALDTMSPYTRITILSETLIIKSIYLSNLS